jgi:hypothetical protein
MSEASQRRAVRLARLYPRQWRHDYPDFVDALADELDEHRPGAASSVLRAASVERLRSAGLLSRGPHDLARSGLALVCASVLPFVGLSMGMWSQLRTANNHGSSVPALTEIDLILAVGTAIALLSLVVVVALVVSQARSRHDSTNRAPWPRAMKPAAVLASAMVALTFGGLAADHSNWYSPAAAALPASGVGHFLTLWARCVISDITPAWLHPSIFGRMPAGELAATFIAPVAVLFAAGAVLRLLVQAPFSASQRLCATSSLVVFLAMLASAAATIRWLVISPSVAYTKPNQFPPGHTPWGVATLLLVLLATAAIGTRRILRNPFGSGATSASGQSIR